MIESSFVKYQHPAFIILVVPPIDETFVEIPPNALGKCSPPQTYPSKIHANVSVTINLSYSLGCSPNCQLRTVNTTLQCVCADECNNGGSYMSNVESNSRTLNACFVCQYIITLDFGKDYDLNSCDKRVYRKYVQQTLKYMYV